MDHSSSFPRREPGTVAGHRRAWQTHTGFSSPLAGLTDEIRGNIVRSEIEGGLRLSSLAEGARVLVETINRLYKLEIRGGHVWISGHPEFCPRPVQVRVRGSSWGGSMLKVAYLGRGMQMEFEHPLHATVTTSRIVSIRVD